MSASGGRWPLIFCGLIAAASAAFADDEAEADETPDLEFLEYLGMWEESDEEWLLLDDDPVAREAGLADTDENDGSLARQGPETTVRPEKHDES